MMMMMMMSLNIVRNVVGRRRGGKMGMRMSSMMRRRFSNVVAITGSSGIIGSRIYHELEREGYECIGISDGLDRSQGGPGRDGSKEVNRDLVDRVVDVSCSKSSKDMFLDCTHVIHLAGDGRPDASFEEVVRTNIMGTYNVLEEAKRSGTVQRVVFASTNHTQHGLTMNLTQGPGSIDRSRLGGARMKLSDVAFPDSYYAVSKLCGEDIGKYYSQTLSCFEFIALRIGWCLYDDPRELKGTEFEEYLRAMYLSRRDCINFVKAALKVSLGSQRYACAYAVSDNSSRVFDLEETAKVLGYYPMDSSDSFDWSKLIR
jgi:nucleoside-diphosphate-sugar epimerase